MNGYYARVQRHRQMLAEQAARTEEAAVSSFDWVCAPVDGITDAVAAAVPHRHARAGDKPDKSANNSTAEPAAEGTSPTGPVTWPQLPPPPGGESPWWAQQGPQPTAWGEGLPAAASSPAPRRGRAWIAALIAALVLLSGGIGMT